MSAPLIFALLSYEQSIITFFNCACIGLGKHAKENPGRMYDLQTMLSPPSTSQGNTKKENVTARDVVFRVPHTSPNIKSNLNHRIPDQAVTKEERQERFT